VAPSGVGLIELRYPWRVTARELVVKKDECGVPPTDVDALSKWSTMAKEQRKCGVPPTDVDAQLRLVDSKPKREREVKKDAAEEARREMKRTQ